MILGAVYRSPGICLTAEENPRNPQLGDRLMKGLGDQSSTQMGSVRKEGRRTEIRKGRSEVIYLTAEENPGKSKLGDHLKKVVQSVIVSNGVHYHQARTVG